MDLVRRTPERPLRDPHTELRRMFESPLFDLARDGSTVKISQWIPSVDIRDEQDRFLVEADIPGVKPQDIEVTMDKGVLSIRGERRHEQTESEGGYRRVERAEGMFYHRFALPESADPENIKARGENGMLKIEIGKRERARSRRIPVEQ